MVKCSVIDHCQTFLLSTISSLEKFEKSKFGFYWQKNSEGGANHIFNYLHWEEGARSDHLQVGNQLLQGNVENKKYLKKNPMIL